jgi:ATP-binding cassette subfamily B protein
MWRALKRGYEAEPLFLVVAFSLALLAALPDALLALLLKLLADGLLAHNRGLVLASAIGLGVAASATWFLRVISDRTQRRFRERVTIALESHVARLQASVATIEHHERPEFLNRLAVLRDQVFVLDHMYMSLFSTCGWILRLGVTLALLVSIHPVLVLLALFAIPPVLASTWRPGVERAAQEQGAPANRLARHLFVTATTAPPGKEVRVAGIGNRLAEDRRASWERWYGPVAAARWGSALWHTLAWAIFGAGFLGAIAFTAFVIHAAPGSILLVLVAGSRLSAYIGATVGEIGFLRGIWLDGSRRLAWLEDYVAALTAHADAPVPEVLADGIRFEHVSFAYPETERLVLDDVCLDLKAGTVVAIVGENGAGKTTLVKLLCRLYQPTSGRILIDGRDLARMSVDAWRSRLAGAFQDFYRFEFKARHTVGVGDVPRLDDEPAVATAVTRSGADDVVSRLTSGLETQLAPPGRRAWKSASASGRNSRWHVASCAIGHSFWCWMSQPLRSMPKPSTHSSSATRPSRAAEDRMATLARLMVGSRSWCLIVLARCGWPISSWCSMAPGWSRWDRTRNSWQDEVTTPSSTKSRPPRTARA